MKRIPLAVVLLVLVLLPAAAEGAAVYVQRTLVAGPGNVTIGDLLQPSGDLPAQARETLSRSAAVISDTIVYVPSSSYRADLQTALGADAIIVGARTAIIPQGSAADGQAWLVDRLVEWLLSQHLLGGSTVQIRIAQIVTRGTAPADGTPAFQATRSSAGGTDVTVSVSGVSGSITGRFSLPAPAAGEPSQGIKAGTPVDVVFHKGMITIEMPGRTLATASVGDTVAVALTDSQKSFSGVLVDGKAVDVELP